MLTNGNIKQACVPNIHAYLTGFGGILALIITCITENSSAFRPMRLFIN